MSNHSLPAGGTDPPFSHKSVVSITHERNIICSKTLICRQLLAGHIVSSRPIERKEKIHRMITRFICRKWPKIDLSSMRPEPPCTPLLI